MPFPHTLIRYLQVHSNSCFSVKTSPYYSRCRRNCGPDNSTLWKVKSAFVTLYNLKYLLSIVRRIRFNSRLGQQYKQANSVSNTPAPAKQLTWHVDEQMQSENFKDKRTFRSFPVAKDHSNDHSHIHYKVMWKTCMHEENSIYQN